MQHTVALQVQSSGLPSIFLTAQPQPTFYLSSKTFQGLLTLQGFYPSMTTFLAAFFLASSSPQKEFSRTKMAIGVFYSQVFFKKIQCSNVQVSRTSDFAEFPSWKNVKNKNKNKQTKKTPGLCEILGGVCDRVVNTSNPRIWRSGVQASPAALFP